MCVSLYLLTPYIWSVQIICKHTYAHNFLCGRKFISSRLRVNFFAGRNLCAPVCNFFASRKPSKCLLEFTRFNTYCTSVPSVFLPLATRILIPFLSALPLQEAYASKLKPINPCFGVEKFSLFLSGTYGLGATISKIPNANSIGMNETNGKFFSQRHAVFVFFSYLRKYNMKASRGMYRLKRIAVWLMRWHRCRGFGVQSPSDYEFIRYVINEHYPYYAYADLDDKLQDTDPLRRKRCRLYFRIANYLQPETFIDIAPETDAYRRYVEAGCRRTKTVTAEKAQEALRQTEHIDFMRIKLTDGNAVECLSLLDKARDRSLFVFEEIHRNKCTKALWKAIKAHCQTVVTFDLYYCGLVFFNKKRYQHNYIVNF